MTSDLQAAREAVCDLVWKLLEPWDKDIAAHDDELHAALDALIAEAQREAVAALPCFWCVSRPCLGDEVRPCCADWVVQARCPTCEARAEGE